MNKKKKKKSVGRKVIKWIVGISLAFLLLLVVSPYLFKDKIKEMVLKTIHKNINASVSFDEIDLSFFRNFPRADISINHLQVINNAPFEGDTLLYAKEFHMQMKISELFKSKHETMQLQNFSVENGDVHIQINKAGKTNYDITIPKKSNESSEANSSFSLDIQDYVLSNINFSYYDKTTDMMVKVDSIYHFGKGNFAQDILDLETTTNAYLSIDIGGVNYMAKVRTSLDAIFGIDIQNLTYTFKRNKGFVNQFPIEFDGFIQLLEKDQGQLYDLTFKTPTSSFKNLLGIIPSQYAGNLENVETKGSFDLNGVVKGIYTENTIPSFNITFTAKDAMFKYPQLPKAVERITLNSKISNTTGSINDTKVDINQLTFSIDQDTFFASGHIANIVTNPFLSLSAKGKINLDHLSKSYPVPDDIMLSGLIAVNMTSNFDIRSVEQKQYQNIKNSGEISISQFTYETGSSAQPFRIEKSSVTFHPENVALKEFKASIGDSDMSIQGALHNFYGFLFKNEVLQGNFTLSSNQIKVADFMTSNTKELDTTVISKSTIKVPSFLDCTIHATANNVVYDGIRFKNTSGRLLVKDESIIIENVNMNAFDGSIKLGGKVSTKEEVPNFSMNLQLENVNIKESFSQLPSLNTIAPIANVVGGKLNSSVNMKGSLTKDLTPTLESISGDLLGQLLNSKLNASESNVLNALNKEIGILDLSKLDLSSIKTYLTFKNGNVVVKPFNVKFKDVNILIGGKHGFDQSMNYNLTLEVPVEYLGDEITSLTSKLSGSTKIKSIPVKATLTGNFSNPKVQTDLKEATSNLAAKLAKEQKDKLLDKGKNKLLNLLNKDKDSSKTKKDSTANKVKNVLKGLFKKKKKDS